MSSKIATEERKMSTMELLLNRLHNVHESVTALSADIIEQSSLTRKLIDRPISDSQIVGGILLTTIVGGYVICHIFRNIRYV